MTQKPEYPNIDLILKSTYGKYFCEIDKEFFTDKFNLTGIPQEFFYFEKVYKILLSDKPLLTNHNQIAESDFQDLVTLYGLIHARFILTGNGLHKMRKKFLAADYGQCPRYYCRRQNLLPIGLSAVSNELSPKGYCPNCEDVYCLPAGNSTGKAYQHLDGAFFGPTFAHFFLLSFPELLPPNAAQQQQPSKNDVFVPKVFGFRLFNQVEHDTLHREQPVAEMSQ